MTPSNRSPRVVFLDRATLPKDIELRQLGFPHELVLHDSTTPDQVVERIAEADIVITNKAPVARRHLRGRTACA